jgi:hypothetical protein
MSSKRVYSVRLERSGGRGIEFQGAWGPFSRSISHKDDIFVIEQLTSKDFIELRSYR